jgi:hypothetical protein
MGMVALIWNKFGIAFIEPFLPLLPIIPPPIADQPPILAGEVSTSIRDMFGVVLLFTL